MKKNFEDSESEVIAKRKQRAQRSDTKRTRDFMKGLEATIDGDPSVNIATLAKNFNTSYSIMWKAVQEDLRYKSYKLQIR